MKKQKISYAEKAVQRAAAVNIEEMFSNMSDGELLEYILCDNHTGKMSQMISMSTAVTVNPRCQARRAAALKAKEEAEKRGLEPEKHICLSCFAESQLEYQTTSDIKYRRAFEILNRKVYAVADFPLINAFMARIESFGDVASVTQAINYIHWCLRNKRTVFAAWTKNPDIWKAAFAIESKPENLIMIYSNPIVDSKIDEKAFFAALKIAFPFLDKMFSVFTETFATENNIKINCGARHCLSCQRCYDFNDIVFIHELLK